MPLFYVLILTLIVVVFISLILNLLFNPVTWIIIGILLIASMIRRYLYRKQLEDFNKEFKKRAAEKKQQYYQKTDSHRRQSNDDIIDVDYEIVDEDDD